MSGPCLFGSTVEVWVHYKFTGRGQTVNQVICMTPFTGSSMKETSETLAERQLVSSPQQCSCTYGTLHPEVPHIKKRLH